MNPIVGFGLARIAERKEKTLETSYSEDDTTNSRDFLSRFLEAQAKDPSIPPWYANIPHPAPTFPFVDATPETNRETLPFPRSPIFIP